MSEQLRMWLGSAWVDAEDGATFDATSPSTGEVIGTARRGRAPTRGGRSRPRRQRGRGGGRFSMERLTELKTIVIDLG
jgi:hypothetical protein